MATLQEKSKCKRKSISKKLRFEVFKRDKFTCQYCGRKAPDVVLQIDHISPVSKGGKNVLMNLVTACMDCNSGKSDRTLDDNSIVIRQQRQAELMAQRREQIEMIRDWHIELAEQRESEIKAVDDLYCKLTNNEYCISSSYKSKTIAELIRKYGLALVLDALADGTNSYGDPHKALNKLPGICACKSDPALNRRVHLLNKMNKRFWNFKRYEASDLLMRGQRAGGEIFLKEVEDLIYQVSGTWWQVKNNFEVLVEDYER
nr:MAG TPA: HNH endonuclease [Caudoviricetes sp.]